MINFIVEKVGGTRYDIKLLYRELAGDAVIQLYWAHSCFNNNNKVIIPTASLYPVGALVLSLLHVLCLFLLFY